MSKLRASNILVKTFFEKHPSDAARALEALPTEEANKILAALPTEAACQTVEFLNPHIASLIFDHFNPEEAKPFLERVSPKKMTDILLDLPKEKKEEFLKVLDSPEARILEALLTYPPETAGGMMTPGVISLTEDLTVDEAIQVIRRTSRKKQLYYVYVTDHENRLEGVLGMRDLILSPPHTTIESLMAKEVVSVPAETDREEVIKIAAKHRYLAIPVVDADKRLLGIIHSEDLIKAADHDRKRLGARISSLARNDRKKNRKRGNLRNRIFENPDHRRSEKGSAEINIKPEQAFFN